MSLLWFLHPRPHFHIWRCSKRVSKSIKQFWSSEFYGMYSTFLSILPNYRRATKLKRHVAIPYALPAIVIRSRLRPTPSSQTQNARFAFPSTPRKPPGLQLTLEVNSPEPSTHSSDIRFAIPDTPKAHSCPPSLRYQLRCPRDTTTPR